MLIEPRIHPSLLMKSLKGATAREANRLLGLTGTAFWQKESYDHWVRDAAEFERVRRYIENNPVKAGIVQAAEEYRWSSAYVDTSVDAAR
jgi:REP element-mobilizing transposase RayT